MKPRISLWVILAVMFALLVSCSRMGNEDLASLQGKTISLDEFTKTYPQSRLAGKDATYIKGRVDEFLRKKLFTLEGRAQGLDQDPDIQEKLIKAERRQMLQYVYDRAIVDVVLNDKALQELYDRSKEEIHARHILIQHKDVSRSQATRDRNDALLITGQIMERLNKGESFEDLANEFTEDPSGKDNGGDLGWFGWGRMVDAFQKAAFALEVGEVSNIIETPFGFHIIKLEGRRDKNLGTLEEERKNLQRELRRSKSDDLRDAANSFLNARKAEAGFGFLNDNLAEFTRIWAGSPQSKDKRMDEVFTDLNYTAPLFTMKGEEYGAEWILAELELMEPGQRPNFTNENQLRTYIDNLVTQALIVDYGKEHGYDQEEAFRDQILDFEDKYIYDQYMHQQVNEQLEPTEADLLAFYEQHKTDKYKELEKVKVREIFVKDEMLAEDLRKRVDAGEDFERLAMRYTERKSTKNKGGELPPFQKGRYGNMGKAAFALEEGQIDGPIQLGNGYSIILLEEKIPEGSKPFEKVKGRIRTDVVSELRENRIEALKDSLAKKYRLKVNYDAAIDFYAVEEEDAAS